jgi:hypothetical protein
LAAGTAPALVHATAAKTTTFTGVLSASASRIASEFPAFSINGTPNYLKIKIHL